MLRRLRERLAPIRHQPIERSETAQVLAAGFFRVKHVAQPEHRRLATRHAIAALKRLHNLERRAQWQYTATLEACLLQRINEERRKATDARLFDHNERRIAEFRRNDASDLFLDFVTTFDWNVPKLELAPIAP